MNFNPFPPDLCQVCDGSWTHADAVNRVSVSNGIMDWNTGIDDDIQTQTSLGWPFLMEKKISAVPPI